MTPKKAPMQATKSNLSTFQIRKAARKSTRLITAEMMIDDMTAFGVYLKRGVITSRVSNTTRDMIILDTGVLQPAI